GHRACAADHTEAARASESIELTNASDKLAPIGKVDVMAAGLDGCTRDAVVLALKGPGGVDQCVDAQLLQIARELGVGCIRDNDIGSTQAHETGGSQGALSVAATEQ